eukprot:378341_1
MTGTTCIERTVCDTPTVADLLDLCLAEKNYNTTGLSRCTNVGNRATCDLKCASGFTKDATGEDLSLTCATQTNSWSMTGTTCVDDVGALPTTPTDTSPSGSVVALGIHTT